MATGIKIRLYVEDSIGPGARLALDAKRAHYLTHVMRRADGDPVALFNGRDGEWKATLARAGKHWTLSVETQIGPQLAEADLWLCFAPIKRARIDFLAEKATELGVSLLQPVFTRHTMV